VLHNKLCNAWGNLRADPDKRKDKSTGSEKD